MRILIRILLSLLCVGYVHLQAENKHKPWTILVYIAGDNNLAKYVDLDLEEMMRVGSNHQVNILAFVTQKLPGKENTTRCLEVFKGECKQHGDAMCMDSGDAKTLQFAVTWAMSEFPSDHIAVVLWDHGSGPITREVGTIRGICFDDTTGNYLTDIDCQQVLRRANDRYRGGKKIDILACDACLMANVEEAYAFFPCADYFVASQETIPGYGYDYEKVLAPFTQGSVSPKMFARAMVDAYQATYGGNSTLDYTLSAANLRLIPSLTANMNQVGHLLRRALKYEDAQKVAAVVKACGQAPECTHFAEATYIDLYQFYNNVLKQIKDMNISPLARIALGIELRLGLEILNNFIIKRVQSDSLSSTHGVSVYMPNIYEGIHSSYVDLDWTHNIAWTMFLEEYLSACNKYSL